MNSENTLTAEDNLTDEDNLLAYKIISLNYNVSFYFWTSIGLGVATVFSSKFFLEAKIFEGLWNQVYLVALSVPVGLLFWRYVINRSDRIKLSLGLNEKSPDIEAYSKKLKELSINFNKRVISTLLRIRSFVALFTVFELILLTYRLSVDLGFSESTLLYAFIASSGILVISLLTLIAKIIYNRDMKIFSKKLHPSNKDIS